MGPCLAFKHWESWAGSHTHLLIQWNGTVLELMTTATLQSVSWSLMRRAVVTGTHAQGTPAKSSYTDFLNRSRAVISSLSAQGERGAMHKNKRMFRMVSAQGWCISAPITPAKSEPLRGEKPSQQSSINFLCWFYGTGLLLFCLTWYTFFTKDPLCLSHVI